MSDVLLQNNRTGPGTENNEEHATREHRNPAVRLSGGTGLTKDLKQSVVVLLLSGGSGGGGHLWALSHTCGPSATPVGPQPHLWALSHTCGPQPHLWASAWLL
ncbi:hypothetical protein EYF80_043344 [Liparis tanakae]|uniref:Uncharacterized protein n=1 Tax=Liparis tanakae TaxID=230148 RepID=A0A4Z2FYP4_9TELE|nr:hypothetical protein EYF80_043344 [Liparis tanakae]